MSKLAFKWQMQMFVSIQMSNANANVSLHMVFKCQMQMFVIPFKCKCKCFTKHLQMYLIWIQMFLNICKKKLVIGYAARMTIYLHDSMKNRQMEMWSYIWKHLIMHLNFQMFGSGI